MMWDFSMVAGLHANLCMFQLFRPSEVYAQTWCVKAHFVSQLSWFVKRQIFAQIIPLISSLPPVLQHHRNASAQSHFHQHPTTCLETVLCWRRDVTKPGMQNHIQTMYCNHLSCVLHQHIAFTPTQSTPSLKWPGCWLSNFEYVATLASSGALKMGWCV